ncbi:hypothetical protein CRG98_009549, partial [Punica granatum]
KAKPSAHSPTSPSSPKGKARSLVSPYHPTEPPASTPAAKATRPQAVRAQATRCTMAADLVTSNTNPPFDVRHRVDPNSQNERCIDQYAQDLEIPRIHHITDRQDVQENCSTDFDFSNFGCGDDRVQASNDDGGEKGNYFGNYYNSHMSMELAILEDWAGKSGDVDDTGVSVEVVKDTFDIESLTFLFDSEQWTCP